MDKYTAGAEKKAAKRPAAAADGGTGPDGGNADDQPAMKKAKAMKPKHPMKRPAAASVVSVVKSFKAAECPKPGAGPVDYKTGRIYTSVPRKAFRVIKDRTNFATEKSIKWSSDKPAAAHWKQALKAIDEYK